MQMACNFRVLGFHLKTAEDNSTAHVMMANTGVTPSYCPHIQTYIYTLTQ